MYWHAVGSWEGAFSYERGTPVDIERGVRLGAALLTQSQLVLNDPKVTLRQNS